MEPEQSRDQAGAVLFNADPKCTARAREVRVSYNPLLPIGFAPCEALLLEFSIAISSTSARVPR